MSKNVIFVQVVTLFLIMGVGFTARKRRIITPVLNKGLTELLIHITTPFMVIAAFQFSFSHEKLVTAGFVFLISLTIHTGSFLISKFIYWRFPLERRKVLSLATIFTNCGFMGYPVVGSLYGSLGIFYTSIYIVVFHLFIWTIGVGTFTGKTDLQTTKKALLNPGIIAVFIGMFLFLFSIRLPEPVTGAIQLIGSMTTPLSMLIIGSMLADIKPADLFRGFDLYYGAFIRLLLLPLLTGGILMALKFNAIITGVCVLAVAMPAASLLVPLAEQNGGDAAFASRLVFLTTLLSVATIPLIIWIV
jgi:predicted permease